MKTQSSLTPLYSSIALIPQCSFSLGSLPSELSASSSLLFALPSTPPPPSSSRHDSLPRPFHAITIPYLSFLLDSFDAVWTFFSIWNKLLRGSIKPYEIGLISLMLNLPEELSLCQIWSDQDGVKFSTYRSLLMHMSVHCEMMGCGCRSVAIFWLHPSVVLDVSRCATEFKL